ncbi:Uncharacterised protein [Klebsiella pneumoniae]|uniref:Uncharacterized protein n=1 Tax=Klebsiella pneumoniae TaxID=573 RepID=A0A447RHA5_KLEPN|nr:Uncharacterised protein [Klebsiella pneumoniae]
MTAYRVLIFVISVYPVTRCPSIQFVATPEKEMRTIIIKAVLTCQPNNNARSNKTG